MKYENKYTPFADQSVDNINVIIHSETIIIVNKLNCEGIISLYDFN